MKARRRKAGAYNPARRRFVRLVACIRARRAVVLAAHASGQACHLPRHLCGVCWDRHGPA